MAENVQLVPLAELQQLEVQCPKCSFIGIFTLEARGQGQEVPAACPSCTAEWAAVQEAVQTMRKAFELASRSMGIMRFRMR